MRSWLLFFISFIGIEASAQIIQNKGQWENNIEFKSEIPGGAVFFEKTQITYNLLHPSDLEKTQSHAQQDSTNSKFRFHSFCVSFLGADSNSIKKGFNPSEEKINYFLGNDASKWASNLSSCEKLVYKGIYKDIDFVYYSRNSNLKYDFVLHPGADVSNIKMQYTGADTIFIDEKGNLKTQLSFTEMMEQKPYAYQIIEDRKIIIPCEFYLDGNRLSFKIKGHYNKKYDLVIDPALIFSTYSGSYSNNYGFTATYDDEGFLYAGGDVFGIGYPTTIGAYDVSFNSTDSTKNLGFQQYIIPDIAITKYDTSGSKRIYSTYIGGSASDEPHSLIVNSKGELVIYGTTDSQDYPTSSSAYNKNIASLTVANVILPYSVGYIYASDIVISKLSADGTQLLSSTYFGGSGFDGVNGDLAYNYSDQMRGEVYLDKEDNIYIASSTFSSDIPGVSGSFQPTLKGAQEGLVAKFSGDLSTLFWASYIGGNNDDVVNSMTLDNNENLVITGGTTSTNLAASPGAIHTTRQGNVDGFVAKISNDGKSLNALTYFGTPQYDQSFIVRMDKQQNIYIYGQTSSTDSSLIKNAKYYSLKSGNFISKLKNDLSGYVWSTKFGSGTGVVNISPTALLVDLCNRVYVTGWGALNDHYFPSPNVNQGTLGMATTPDALQKTSDGNDFYLMVLANDASAISYGSFFGGATSHEHVHGGTNRFDKKGIFYQSVCAGCGGNSDFPTTANAVSRTDNSTNCNNAVFKMDFSLPTVVANFKAISPCAGSHFKFSNISTLQGNTSFYWSFGDGDTSTVFQPTHTYSALGTYNVMLVLNDSTACNLTDTIIKKITVYETPSAVLKDTLTCKGVNIQIGISPLADPKDTYHWIPGSAVSDSTISNPTAIASGTKQFQLIVSNGVCADTFSQKIIVPILDFKIPDSTFCNQKDSSISISVNTLKGKISSYVWSSTGLFNDTLNADISDSVFIYKANNGKTVFYLNIKDSLGCRYTDTLRIYKSQPELQRNHGLCPGINFQIGYSSYSGNGNIYNWSPGEWLSDSTVSNPSASPLTSIDYTLFINVSGVCMDTLIESFLVPVIDIEAKGDTAYCNSAIAVSNGSVKVLKGKGTQFIWSHHSTFNDTLNHDLSTSAVSLPIVDGVNKFYVREMDSTGCFLKDSIVIVKDIIQADLPAQQSFCQNDPLTLKVNSPQWNSNIKIAWMDTADITSGFNSQTIQLKNAPGNLIIYAQLTDSAGCSAKDSTEIYISDLSPSALKAWADKDTLLLGASTVLHVLPNGNKYLWSPFETLDDASKQNPIATPANTTSYQVALSDPAALSCSFTTGVTVYVYEPTCGKNDIYIPNIFTPNGDGKNDVMYVRGNNISEMYFTIYDRWGEMVFATKDQSVGWNGEYKTESGEPAVFVYYLTVKCGDGKEYFHKGNITVMR